MLVLVSVAATSPSAVSSTPLQHDLPPARARHLAATGHRLDDSDMERLSLLRPTDITLTGRYRIALLEPLPDGGNYRERNTTPAIAANPVFRMNSP